MATRRLKAVIEYDGTSYQGWQSQTGGRTIQDVLEAAFSRILDHPVRIYGSGRTDSGVHALGQVAHLATTSDRDLASLQRGVNSLLPPDILVKSIELTDEQFHARFSAASRLYEYHIWNADLPSVFCRSVSWWIRGQLDVEAMEAAARSLHGTHDFSSFQGADHEQKNAERIVISTGFRREAENLVFSIHANAFLRHMVRNIIGTLVEVGKGRLTPEGFKAVLECRNRSQAGVTAPACGLFLIAVYYRAVTGLTRAAQPESAAARPSGSSSEPD